MAGKGAINLYFLLTSEQNNFANLFQTLQSIDFTVAALAIEGLSYLVDILEKESHLFHSPEFALLTNEVLVILQSNLYDANFDCTSFLNELSINVRYFSSAHLRKHQWQFSSTRLFLPALISQNDTQREVEMKKLISYLHENDVDITISLLALNTIVRIQESMQLPISMRQEMSTFLCKWRSKGQFRWVLNEVSECIQRTLSIFESLQVPLFIDNYGRRQFPGDFASVPITKDTKIFHVTHNEEAASINRAGFHASAHKNSVPGVWFSMALDDKLPLKSHYGNHFFYTTLGQLGITTYCGLVSGEIIGYKQELNAIFYPCEERGSSEVIHVPTSSGDVNKLISSGAYVAVSLFVLAKYLPKNMQEFSEKFEGPIPVNHGHGQTFCVRERRGGYCN